jgi:hypothetical protein
MCIRVGGVSLFLYRQFKNYKIVLDGASDVHIVCNGSKFWIGAICSINCICLCQL